MSIGIVQTSVGHAESATTVTVEFTNNPDPANLLVFCFGASVPSADVLTSFGALVYSADNVGAQAFQIYQSPGVNTKLFTFSVGVAANLSIIAMEVSGAAGLAQFAASNGAGGSVPLSEPFLPYDSAQGIVPSTYSVPCVFAIDVPSGNFQSPFVDFGEVQFGGAFMTGATYASNVLVGAAQARYSVSSPGAWTVISFVFVDKNSPFINGGVSQQFNPGLLSYQQLVTRAGNDGKVFSTGTLNFLNKQSYVIDFTALIQSQKILNQIQACYVDNSHGNGNTYITVNATGQTITVPPGVQGYYPLIALEGSPVFTITNYSGLNYQQVASFYLPSMKNQGLNSPTAEVWFLNIPVVANERLVNPFTLEWFGPLNYYETLILSWSWQTLRINSFTVFPIATFTTTITAPYLISAYLKANGIQKDVNTWAGNNDTSGNYAQLGFTTPLTINPLPNQVNSLTAQAVAAGVPNNMEFGAFVFAKLNFTLL